MAAGTARFHTLSIPTPQKPAHSAGVRLTNEGLAAHFCHCFRGRTGTHIRIPSSQPVHHIRSSQLKRLQSLSLFLSLCGKPLKAYSKRMEVFQ